MKKNIFDNQKRITISYSKGEKKNLILDKDFDIDTLKRKIFDEYGFDTEQQVLKHQNKTLNEKLLGDIQGDEIDLSLEIKEKDVKVYFFPKKKFF